MATPPAGAAARPFAVVVGTTRATIAGIVAFTAAAGVTGSITTASLVAGGVVGGLLWHAGATTRPAAVPASARLAFTIGAALLLLQLLFAAAFVIDPTVTRWDPRPWAPQRSSHSCVSAYWVACEAVTRTPAIYDEALYNLPQEDPAAPRRPRALGPLAVDNFEYPPAFLVLPRLLTAVTPDFWAFRRVWFALMLAVTAAGAAAIGARVDAAVGGVSVWLTPYVLAAPAMVMTLIVGNVQLAIIAASLLAMLAFERRRPAIGGAVLAYVTLSKLYPGLLVFYLLLRRDWRAVAWTTAWGAAVLLASLADIGIAPYQSFVHELPSLLGGEAFAAFRNPVSMAINESIPGVPFKLALLGVPHMGFAASKVVGWLYTAVVLAVTARLALRPARAGLEPLVWLALLILATMRSPFLPSYAPFPSLWLATLIAGVTWDRSLTCATAVALWVVLAFSFGAGGAPVAINALWTFAHTAAAFVLVVLACRVTAPAVDAVRSRPAGALAAT